MSTVEDDINDQIKKFEDILEKFNNININEPVLEIYSLPSSINIEKLKDEVKKYIESRLDFYKNSKRNLYIEDEFSEYWLSKVSNGTEIGKGSGGMDVKTSNNEGIDAMCVIMNSIQSNEKSLIQNFDSAGVNLDDLFLNKKDDEAIKLYIDVYKNKILKIKKDKNLSDLYIIAFISTKNKIYLTCFKLNINNIKNIKSNGFTKTEKNIKISNFIDDKYGIVTLYKSKKRIELRLKIECIHNPFTQLLFSNDNNLSEISSTTGTDIALPDNL